MITIRYQDDGRKRKLTVEGHGGGEPGKDIYCAAASTLVIALESALSEADITHETEVRDGYARVACDKDESRPMFYTCMCGFYTLAQMYPAYYKIC